MEPNIEEFTEGKRKKSYKKLYGVEYQRKAEAADTHCQLAKPFLVESDKEPTPEDVIKLVEKRSRADFDPRSVIIEKIPLDPTTEQLRNGSIPPRELKVIVPDRLGRPQWRIPMTEEFEREIDELDEKGVQAKKRGDEKRWRECRNKWRKKWEDLIKQWLDQNPDLAVELARDSVGFAAFIRDLVQTVNFIKYGLRDEAVTKLYLDWLGQLNNYRTKKLIRREGPHAVASEAGLAIVDTYERMAQLSAWAMMEFVSYLKKVFSNNLLKALCQDDISLMKGGSTDRSPLEDFESRMGNYDPNSEFGKKLIRRQETLKQVAREAAERDQEEIEKQYVEKLDLDLDSILEELPEDRQKKVLIRRFVEDRTQIEVAKELGVTERTVRNDEQTIKEVVIRLNPHIQAKSKK